MTTEYRLGDAEEALFSAEDSLREAARILKDLNATELQEDAENFAAQIESLRHKLTGFGV